jgi:predicted GH43/DUF377 family glycosyl hydrolase
MTTAESVPSQTSRTARGIAVHDLVTRKNLRLNRDPRRVVTKPFVPGARPVALNERAARIVERVMELDDADVAATYSGILRGFGDRHRDLPSVFAENFRAMRHRVARGTEVDDSRRLLLGAMFTHEIAIEGAALTNPSMVVHPDQGGLAAGEVRFVMSARAIGEGHVSCVEFRVGVVSEDGDIRVEDPAPYATCGNLLRDGYERVLLEAALDRPADDDEALAFLLRRLPDRFTGPDLERVLSDLHPHLLVMASTHQTISDAHWFLACQYLLGFDGTEDISERVLWPMSPTEQHGIEDARFVRFTEADGRVDYRATYTAYDGSASRTQLIRTEDFRSFRVSQLFGPAVGEKGLALFPRPVGGRYLAMSRWDQENNAIAISEDGMIWPEAVSLAIPPRIWRLMQVGNCGSPIETEAGWLVLTHGVGPMRVYSLGALLLDLDDPTRVLGALDDPLLSASPDERDGYVPNVVYSCGGLKCGDTLVVPYGFGDMGIEFATASIPELLDRMSAPSR